MDRRSLKLHAFAAGALGFFTITWFYLGLPYNFSADLPAHDTALKHFGYADLVRYTLNPLTPAWFFMTEIGYLRPIYYLIVKLFFDYFGANLVPVHVAVAVGLACLSMFFFTATALITKRKWVAWLIVLLYLGIPTNAPMIAGYLSLDLQYLHSLISIGALGCLAALTFPSVRKRGAAAGLIVAWILLTWISIKWKSSEKLLPFIYGAFLVWKSPGLLKNFGFKRPLILVAINLAMLLLVIPVKKFDVTLRDTSLASKQSSLHIYTVKDQRMFRSDPKNIWYRSFFAPGQPNPLLNITSNNMPYSLSGDLGPLLFFFFFFSMGGSFWLIKRRRLQTKLATADTPEHLFELTLIWFLVTLASFASGAPLEEVRYLNFALVPMMLLLGFLIRFWFDLVHAKLILKRGLTVFLLVIFAIPITQNFLTLSKWTGHFGGMQHVLYELEKTVYERLYGPLPSPLQLHYQHPELERAHEFTSWYNQSSDWMKKTLRKIEEKERIFVFARSEDDPRLRELRAAGVQLSNPTIFPLIEARPLMFAVARGLNRLGLLKKMKRQEVLLYEATITTASTPVKPSQTGAAKPSIALPKRSVGIFLNSRSSGP